MPRLRVIYNTDLLDGEAWNKAIEKAQRRTERPAIGELNAVTPVDTGLLNSQWEVKGDGLGLAVENSTEYASYVNEGTSKMTARNMTGKAMPKIINEYEKNVLDEIERL